MVNKLIVDGLNITLTESTALPFTYTFSTAGIHNVRVGLDDTEEICAYAFKDCADLTKVTFPSKITMIKRNAFENCESLKSINIPSTIKYVGPNVFDGCSSLEEINFEDTTPPQFLTNLTDGTTCYIPDYCKFILADELVKDGSVQYYEKNELGGYDEVDYEALEDGNEYYYDGWLGVHTHTNVVEARFKNKPTEVAFYDGETKATDFPQIEQGNEADLFEHRFVPANTSNTNVVFISNNPKLVSVSQEGHIKCAKNMGGIATIYVCTEPDYNGTYVYASLRVRVTNNTGIVKTDPVLSFSVNELEITNAENFTLPILTNENNVEITWASSNNDVANIDNNGQINIVGNGTTIIKAIFEGNDIYNAKEISYTLTINIPVEKEDPELSFSTDELKIIDAENFTLPTLTNENNVAITWTSSDENVATINSNGKITIVGNGTTIIKAIFEGNEAYNAKEISYTLIINIQNEEPPIDEPTGEEPPIDEPTGEEPPIDEPTGEEPVEPVIDGYKYYLSETEQSEFTENDLNIEVTKKPLSITLHASSDDVVSVWIYPKSWGKPTHIEDENGNDMTNMFIYDDDWMVVPENYYGGWAQTDGTFTFLLTWND
jgi:hypothetical protein